MVNINESIAVPSSLSSLSNVNTDFTAAASLGKNIYPTYNYVCVHIHITVCILKYIY